MEDGHGKVELNVKNTEKPDTAGATFEKILSDGDTCEIYWNSEITAKIIPDEHYAISDSHIDVGTDRDSDIGYTPCDTVWTYRSADGSVKTTWENIRIQSAFRALRFNVTFKLGNGQQDETVVVEYGGAVTPPEPYKQGHMFAGWDVPTETFACVTENLTATALYTVNSYDVKFVDYDGSEISTVRADYGSNVSYPAHPERTDYNSSGWYPNAITSMPDREVTVIAQYTIKSFSVTFDDQAAVADFIDAQNYAGTYNIHA